MHSRFQAALTTLAADLQAAIAPMFADPHFPALLEADQVATLQHATGLDEDALAFALLPLAAACARPDLSHFNVGAIARGVSGRWYFGGNMEFLGATMQQTVHAEQSAISHAWLRGETSLRAITVNYTPCGHCRQFMNELNSGLALRIHLPGALADPEPVGGGVCDERAESGPPGSARNGAELSPLAPSAAADPRAAAADPRADGAADGSGAGLRFHHRLHHHV